MPFYALVLSSDHGYRRAHPIRADEFREADDRLVFLWDDRIVHQAPLRLVESVETFETAGQLHRFILAFRRRPEETARYRQPDRNVPLPGKTPPADRTGQLAERISVSFETTAKAGTKGRR